MVSVIIPVFNGEKYINNIVSNFEKQKDQDFELIFINDGSKDTSLELLNKCKITSTLKIRIIDQENNGVSYARNVGIENSIGKYVCFCDVDDEISEDYISDMRKAMQSEDADLVICKTLLFKNDSVISNGEKKYLNCGTGNVVYKDTITCLRDFLYGRIVSGCCTIMVKRELLIKNNLRFAEGMKYSEDLHMLWRIICFSKKIGYLDKYLYIYMIQPNSATSVFNSLRLQGYLLMKDLEDFFVQNNSNFAPEFIRFGAARMMWSIAWQSAVNYDLKSFKLFIEQHDLKKEMRKLATFKSNKVSLSAIVFLISPRSFMILARLFGKNRIH